MLRLFFDARGAAIKEVHFPAVLGPSYVYASKPAIRRAVDQFLGFEASGGPRGSLDAEEGQRPAKKKQEGGAKIKVEGRPGGDGLVAGRGRGPAPQARRWRARSAPGSRSSTRPGCPRVPTTSPATATSTSRTRASTTCATPDGRIHGAYRMTLQLPPLGDYFGVQGIRGWSDPPILSGPSVTKTIGGRDYEIFLDGDRVRLVAWHEGDNTYWVSNSLLQTLTNDQMIGIARSARVHRAEAQAPLKKGKRG